MGLTLARIGAVATHPATRAAAGFVGASALAAGTVLAAQYGYGEDFSTGSGIPNPISWEYGVPAAAGVVAGVTGGILSRPGAYRDAWAHGTMLAGAGLGVAAGLFLVAPLAREVMADR
jgi:hypothetical protein